MPTSVPLPVIGWRERVDFPQWKLRRVRTKIDTGARTSAIDVAEIEDLGDGRIRFEVVYRVAPTRRTKWITATPTRTSTVKPSTGEAQTRYVCTTRVVIGAIERDIEVSLVCRRGMLSRMLLGRTAVAGVATVDPENTYLLTRPPGEPRPTESNQS